jgi:hypothetical protein
MPAEVGAVQDRMQSTWRFVEVMVRGGVAGLPSLGFVLMYQAGIRMSIPLCMMRQLMQIHCHGQHGREQQAQHNENPERPVRRVALVWRYGGRHPAQDT